MSALLLENNPLRCACGGAAQVIETVLDPDACCACRECGRAAFAATAPEAEAEFTRTQTRYTTEEQAMKVLCREGAEGAVVVCGVTGAALDYALSPYLCSFPRLGCIVVDTSDEDDWLAERDAEFRSYVLFAPGWWREAWSIARRLRHSHPGCAALAGSRGMTSGIHLVLAPHHRLCIDGQEVFH